MEKKHYFFRWLTLIVIGCLSVMSANAVSVNIQGLTSSGTVDGYPLYEVSSSTITVSSSSGNSFNYVYIDDKQVAYKSSSVSGMGLSIGQYFDGEQHKIQLKSGSTDRGTSYIKYTSTPVDGIFYVVNGNSAAVIGAVQSIENANIKNEVTIGDTSYPVNAIGEYAFANRASLQSITIPNSVSSVGNYAFYQCPLLTSLDIESPSPSETNTPHAISFENWTSTNRSDGSTSSKEYKFYGTAGASISFNYTVSSESGYDFLIVTINGTEILKESGETSGGITHTLANSGDVTLLVSYTKDSSTSSGSDSGSISDLLVTGNGFYDGLYSIGNYAFSGCSLESIFLPNTLRAIGTYAFSNNAKLKSVIIPQSVTSIGSYAFTSCSSLVKNAYPSNLSNPFSYAYGTSISYPADAYIDSTHFIYSSDKSELYFAPIELDGAYVISDEVSKIGANAFRGCAQLTSINIPESIASIGNYAFSGCSNLSSLLFNATNCTSCGSSSSPAFPSTISLLTFGDKVTTIPAYFLYSGSQIENVVLPSSLTKIGASAFLNSSKLASIEIPESVTTIGNSAFAGCTSLTSLVFNASNCSNFSSSAFPSSISTLTIGGNVTTIPEYFLYNGSQIENVVLPSSLTKIGASAFLNSSKLASIEIPESVTTIGNSAFDGCTSLTSLVYNASNCTNFSSSSYPAFPSSISLLTFGDKVTTIPAYFLYSGSQIENVVLPSSLTKIGESALRNSSKLASIEIPESVTTIGNSAFDGCTSLTSLVYNASNCTNFSSSSYPAFPSSISLLTFGDKVTTIPAYFLYSGSQIENVVLPSSLTKIGASAFLNSSKLTSIEIPESVTTIGGYAFAGCTSLKSLTLGSGLLSIGSQAFSYRDNSGSSYNKINISKVFWLGNTPPSGISEVQASVNYVANDQYTFTNQKKYQFLSSKFEVDGAIYVPVSPSERTCDVIDCEYSLQNGNVVISDKVVNRGVELSVLNINDLSFASSTC